MSEGWCVLEPFIKPSNDGAPSYRGCSHLPPRSFKAFTIDVEDLERDQGFGKMQKPWLGYAWDLRDPESPSLRVTLRMWNPKHRCWFWNSIGSPYVNSGFIFTMVYCGGPNSHSWYFNGTPPIPNLHSSINGRSSGSYGWLRKRNIFQAIFWGDIPWGLKNRPNIDGRYLQSVGSCHGHWAIDHSYPMSPHCIPISETTSFLHILYNP